MSDSVIKLRLIRPGVPDEDITVKGDCALVGRSMECDVRIDQPYVSKRHLRIFKGYVVVDLESRNGTYIEGVMVSEPTLLDGTRISLGDQDAILEIVREDDIAAPIAADRDVATELERLRRRNKELSKLVMHLEDELADTRRLESPLEETMEIRRAPTKVALPSKAARPSVEAAETDTSGRSTLSIDNLEADALDQLRNLSQIEAELAEARKQLEAMRSPKPE